MAWLEWLGKGILSGALVVVASEIAKKSSIFGALIVSLPLVSIFSIFWLYNDTKDTTKVADFAESILWLVIPALSLFIILPYLLRRGWSFEVSMILGIIATIITYTIGIYVSTQFNIN